MAQRPSLGRRRTGSGERGVVRADLELADDPPAYTSKVAQTAATAGIPFRSFPRGTEYVYPAVARIGRGPVVCWQRRGDFIPRPQPVVPGTVVFDSSSEEGRMLLGWASRPVPGAVGAHADHREHEEPDRRGSRKTLIARERHWKTNAVFVRGSGSTHFFNSV
jgi:hypothetical protein